MASGQAYAEQPATQSSVAEQFDRLNAAINSMNSAAQHLGDRLSPVLMPEPPTAVGSNSPVTPVPCGCPLTLQLRASIDHVEAITEILQRIQSRLEV